MPDWKPPLLQGLCQTRHAFHYHTYLWDLKKYIIQVILLLSHSFSPFKTVSSCEEL